MRTFSLSVILALSCYQWGERMEANAGCGSEVDAVSSRILQYFHTPSCANTNVNEPSWQNLPVSWHHWLAAFPLGQGGGDFPAPGQGMRYGSVM